MPAWLEAGLWGLLSGGALVVGAAVGYRVALPTRVVAGVMAFGAGVLISALSFELILEAFKQGGQRATALGFTAGAVVYSVANWLVARLGALGTASAREDSSPRRTAPELAPASRWERFSTASPSRSPSG